jgi:Mrp family chromosome partitioning ATPase
VSELISRVVDSTVDVASAPTAPATNGVANTPSSRSAIVENEGFRLLALNVERLLAGESRRSIVVMSAHSWEGRSTTAAGLALALAKTHPPVLLIDADPEGSGLGDLVPTKAAHGGVSTTLRVLHPGSGLHRMSDSFLEDVRDACGEALDEGATVVIDAPACATSSAGFYLAATATGVLYVTRTTSSRNGIVHADVGAQLELLGARVLGVVVNEG